MAHVPAASVGKPSAVTQSTLSLAASYLPTTRSPYSPVNAALMALSLYPASQTVPSDAFAIEVYAPPRPSGGAASHFWSQPTPQPFSLTTAASCFLPAPSPPVSADI